MTVHGAGLPTRDEVIARYAEGSTRPLDDVDWYQVLACYRLGIILEGSWARYLAGQATEEVGERLGRLARELFGQAHEITA